jgi:hypothetical protein
MEYFPPYWWLIPIAMAIVVATIMLIWDVDLP